MLNEVVGASATNTVTFQSADANADSVIWQTTTNSSATNYILKLNGADHVTLKNITFKNQASLYSRKIVLYGVTDSVTIENNKFLGYQGSSSSNHASIYGSGADATGLKIKNSIFTDAGGYAIYLDSDNSSSPPTGLEISSNTFTDTYSGIYAQYFDALTIRGNTIVGSYMLDKGIYLSYCDGANVVEDNHINAPDLNYGMYLNYCQATSGSKATIVNNMINAGDYGIYLYNNNNYYNVYYNSVKVLNNNALYYYVNPEGNVFKDNIFYTQSASSTALYVYNTTGWSSDYNDFYSNYTYPIYFVGDKDLSTFQAFGHGANSVNLDPVFDSDSTLVPIMPALDNLGTPITGITDDIYGSTRSTTTPDMGAVEFTPAAGSALSGTYTIGSGGNYASFQAARNAFTAYGVSGPVIFNILAGTYDEQLILTEVVGASATNTVTFQSADANADSVIWQTTTNSIATNYILKLNGADHVTLKHITFKNQGSSYSQKIVLYGVTDSVTIDNSKFLGYKSSSTNHVSIYGSGADATGLKIKNSTFTDAGYYAIYLNSNNSSSSPTGLEISSNTFTDTYGGIYAIYYDALTIRGNTIVGSYMYDKGIYLYYCDGANVIEDNHINAPDLTYGIYQYDCRATSGNEATIVNNLINVEDRGIHLDYYNYYQNIYYNTVKVRDEYALSTNYGHYYNNLKNNILLTESTSNPAAHFYNTSVFSSSDYNDFYSNSGYPIYYSGNRTLAWWQAYGQDSNSVSIDPIFNADSSLVPQVLPIDNLGTPISGITDDIHGSTRSTTTPDMGAVEFSLTGTPLSGSYTVGSGGNFATFDSLNQYSARHL